MPPPPVGRRLVTAEQARGTRASIVTPLSVLSIGLLLALAMMLSTVSSSASFRRRLSESAILRSSGATTQHLMRREAYGVLLIFVPTAVLAVAGALLASRVVLYLLPGAVDHVVNGIKVPIGGTGLILAASLGASLAAGWLPLLSLRRLGVSGAIATAPNTAALGRRQRIVLVSCGMVVAAAAVKSVQDHSQGLAVLSVVALLLLTSSLIGVTLRVAARVYRGRSVVVRLALRELGRYTRLSSTVVATLIVSLVLAITSVSYLLGDVERQRLAYAPVIVPGIALLQAHDSNLTAPIAADIAGRLGTTALAPIILAGPKPLAIDADGNAPKVLVSAPGSVRAVAEAVVADDRTLQVVFTQGSRPVVTPAHPLVVTDPLLQTNGKSLIVVTEHGRLTSRTIVASTVVQQSASDRTPRAYLLPAFFTSHKIATHIDGYLFNVPTHPSPARIASTDNYRSLRVATAELVVERGYQGYANGYFTYLVAASLLLSTGASIVLALVSGQSLRPYLRMLVSVGADPRILLRVTLTASAATVVLGLTTGFVVGLASGFLITASSRSFFPFVLNPEVLLSLGFGTLLFSLLGSVVSLRAVTQSDTSQ